MGDAFLDPYKGLHGAPYGLPENVYEPQGRRDTERAIYLDGPQSGEIQL